MAAGPHINTARLQRGPAKSVGAGAVRVSSPSSFSGHFLVLRSPVLGSGVGSVPASCSQGVLGAFTRLKCEGSGAYPAVGVCPVSLIAGEELCGERSSLTGSRHLSLSQSELLQLLALPYSCSHGRPRLHSCLFPRGESHLLGRQGCSESVPSLSLPLKWFSGAEMTSSWQRNLVALRPLLLLSLT